MTDIGWLWRKLFGDSGVGALTIIPAKVSHNKTPSVSLAKQPKELLMTGKQKTWWDVYQVRAGADWGAAAGFAVSDGFPTREAALEWVANKLAERVVSLTDIVAEVNRLNQIHSAHIAHETSWKVWSEW